MENWQQRSINLENQLHYANARIAALEAALAKAREALGECHYRMPKGQTCECPKCAALAAIGEVFHD